MRAKQNHPEAGRTGSAHDHRPKAPFGRVPVVLALTAVVAVSAAAIWTVVSAEGSPGRTAVTPVPVATPTVFDPEQDHFGGVIYVWDPNTGVDSTVVSSPTPLADAELSPDGKRVVYERKDSHGRWQIYLHEADGTEHRLTDMNGGAHDPAWNPNGTRIAFSASRRDGSDSDIFAIGTDGSGLTRIARTSKDDGHPDWSPHGTRLVFESRYGKSIPGGLVYATSVRSRASAPTRLTPGHRPFGAIEPAWSPDGESIAYIRFERSTLNGHPVSAELGRMNTDGTRRVRIGRPDVLCDLCHEPSWSPDGSMIAFTNKEKLRTVRLGSSAPRMRTILVGAGDTSPSWSRKGILMSLPSGDPAPHLRAAPPAFRVEPLGIATITMTRSTCERAGVLGPLPPEQLRLELVHDSRLNGMITIVRLQRDQTLADLMDNPGLILSNDRRRTYYFKASARNVWSPWTDVASGTWAVACWRDMIPAPSGIRMAPVGVVAIRTR